MYKAFVSSNEDGTVTIVLRCIDTMVVCNNAENVDLEDATQEELEALYEEMQDLAAAYEDGYEYFEKVGV